MCDPFLHLARVVHAPQLISECDLIQLQLSHLVMPGEFPTGSAAFQHVRQWGWGPACSCLLPELDSTCAHQQRVQAVNMADVIGCPGLEIFQAVLEPLLNVSVCASLSLSESNVNLCCSVTFWRRSRISLTSQRPSGFTKVTWESLALSKQRKQSQQRHQVAARRGGGAGIPLVWKPLEDSRKKMKMKMMQRPKIVKPKLTKITRTASAKSRRASIASSSAPAALVCIKHMVCDCVSHIDHDHNKRSAIERESDS